MSFNDNLVEVFKIYSMNNNFDFNKSYTSYQIRKIIELTEIYNIGNTIVINSACSLMSNLNISNNATINICTVNNNLTANNIIVQSVNNLSNINVSDICLSNTVFSPNITSNNINCLNISTNNLISLVTNVNNNVNVNYNMTFLGIVKAYILYTNRGINATNCNVIVKNFRNTNPNARMTANSIISYGNLDIRWLYATNINFNNFTVSQILNMYDITVSKTSQINLLNINNIITNKNNSTCGNVISKTINTSQINTANIQVLNKIYANINEYSDNISPNGGDVYRVGDILMIKTNDTISITLNGDTTIYTYINSYFNDPFITTNSVRNYELNYFVNGTVDNTTIGNYILTYYVVNADNIKSNELTRIVSIVNYPILSNLAISNKIITFNITGIYDNIYYFLNDTEILLSSNTIDLNSLLSAEYILLILFKKYNITIKTVSIKITELFAISSIVEFNCPSIHTITTNSFNALSIMKAYTLPNNITTLTNSNIIIKNSNNTQITSTNGVISNLTFGMIYSITNTINNNFIQLSVIDITKPIITLKGSSVMTITVGGVYNESGYIITDNNSAVLASITGILNTNYKGIYYLKYTATDTFNNKSSIIRTITVI